MKKLILALLFVFLFASDTIFFSTITTYRYKNNDTNTAGNKYMPTAPYIGNNDFRGYLAANNPDLLGLVGNDYNGDGTTGVNLAKLHALPGGVAGDVTQGLQNIYKAYQAGQVLPDSATTPQGGDTVYGNTPAAAGSSVTAGVNDPATLAAYDQAIGNTQSAVDRLPGQLNSANNGVDVSFTNALNQLLAGKNQANQSYTTNKQQAGTDFVQAKNTIGANAGNTLNGLLRLLGSRGAGGSSTALLSAPGAVASGATQQRGAATNTFGANNQALDTNWNNYLTGYNNQVTGATSQRDQQKQSNQQQNQSQQASLLQTLASLTGQRTAATGGNATGAAQPYLDQANGILNGLSNYTVNPINYQTQAYQAPSQASYSTNPQATPSYQGQTQANDYTSPYLSALLKQKQPTAVGG
jgi:hypothetical protein